MATDQQRLACVGATLTVVALACYIVSGKARQHVADVGRYADNYSDAAYGGWLDYPGDHMDDGKDGCRWWNCQPWQMRHAGCATLPDTHPLYRRPGYVGENRHKVMVDGWQGWFTQPPSEAML